MEELQDVAFVMHRLRVRAGTSSHRGQPDPTLSIRFGRIVTAEDRLPLEYRLLGKNVSDIMLSSQGHRGSLSKGFSED